MRRPQSAFGLAAVMASLLVVSLSATPAGAAFRPAEVEADAGPVFAASSAQCTKWTNQYKPPKRIRVLRTSATTNDSDVIGTVQTVPFRDYVATVMISEWPNHYPLETLKAGAIATKQFAWYYILNPRGGTKRIDGQDVCYDVVDSVTDQYYKPKHNDGSDRVPGPKILAAVGATWDVTLRKRHWSGTSSRFFLTGYRAGSSNVCGADANGWKLFHNSTRDCGEDGLKYREILRIYLYPRLEIVTPGEGDVIGTRHGDATAAVKDSGRYDTHVWTPGQTPPELGSSTDLSISGDDLVGYRAADMNGDGREDLVWLRQTAARSGRIKVALSNGVDYDEGAVWWEGDTIVPLAGARLLVGDFFANGRVDVAILSRGESAGTARLVVIPRRKYTNTGKFNEPRLWWSGNLDTDRVRAAWAGDVSGDGFADLVVRQTPGAGGVVIKTAMTKSPLPSDGLYMKGMKTSWQTSREASKVKTTAGDADRDGRLDLLLAIATGGRAKIKLLRGTPRGALRDSTLWRAPTSDPIPVTGTRLGAADVDYDGRSDLVLYSKRGNGKTRIRVLKTRYDRMVQGPSWNVGHLWKDVRPY